MITKIPALLALVLLLASCSVVHLKEEAKHVEFAASPDELGSCDYVGEFIGSEGHWYTFLFLANRTLMQSATDDMRNRAAEKGANTLYLEQPQNFASSVTLLGLGYRCPENNQGK